MATRNQNCVDPLVDEYHVLVGKLRVHQRSFLNDESTSKMNPANNPLVLENGKKKSKRLTRSLGDTGSPESKKLVRKYTNATFGNKSRTNSEASALPPLQAYSRFSQATNSKNKFSTNHPDKRLDVLSKVPKPKEGITWFEICQQPLSPVVSRRNYGQRERERSKIILDMKQKWQEVNKIDTDHEHYVLPSHKTKTSQADVKATVTSSKDKYKKQQLGKEEQDEPYSACKKHTENNKHVVRKIDTDTRMLERGSPKSEVQESFSKQADPKKESHIYEKLDKADSSPSVTNTSEGKTVGKVRVKSTETWRTWRDINDSYAYDNVEEYIKENELMPEERAKRIQQWIITMDTNPIVSQTPDTQEEFNTMTSD